METKQKQSAQRIICHMDLRILDAYNLKTTLYDSITLRLYCIVSALCGIQSNVAFTSLKSTISQ